MEKLNSAIEIPVVLDEHLLYVLYGIALDVREAWDDYLGQTFLVTIVMR